MEVLALWGQESNASTPKSYPSPLKIGSRTERSRVQTSQLITPGVLADLFFMARLWADEGGRGGGFAALG